MHLERLSTREGNTEETTEPHITSVENVEEISPTPSLLVSSTPAAPRTNSNVQWEYKSSVISKPGDWFHGATWYRASAIVLRYHKYVSHFVFLSFGDFLRNLGNSDSILTFNHRTNLSLEIVGSNFSCFINVQMFGSGHTWPLKFTIIKREPECYSEPEWTAVLAF